MPSANTESDPFFILLTDALRAGPGSQQWHDAITSLRKEGLEAADEHRLLIEVRENLQAGREYRAVRAGPGFTRKVMAEIEQQGTPGGKKGVPTATIVAIISGILILGAVAFVIWHTSSVTQTPQEKITALDERSKTFVDTIATGNFAGSMPDAWRTIGSLKLDATDGLHPAAGANKEGKTIGGGVVIAKPINANQEFAADITLRAPSPSATMLLEAFVTADGNFSADKATSSRDLVWQLRATHENVLINGGGVMGDTQAAWHAGDGVRLIVGKDVAIVETIPAAGGKAQRLWAGAVDFGPGPRYVGVRFLETGSVDKADVRVEQVKVTSVSNK